MTRNRFIKIYSALAIRLLDGAIAHAILAVASEHAVLSTHNLGHAVAFFVDIAHTIGFDFALRLRQQIVPNLRQDALQLGIFFIADGCTGVALNAALAVAAVEVAKEKAFHQVEAHKRVLYL